MAGRNDLRETEQHPACRLLRELRETAGLTLAEVANKFGIPAAVLGSYERGYRMPPVSRLDEALRIFGYKLAAVPIGEQCRMAGEVASALRLLADRYEALGGIPETD